MALAYDISGTVIGKNEVNAAAITATGNDTTDPANSLVIDNRDGRVSYVSGQVLCTDKTGTSPTINLILQGSVDGSTFASLTDTGGNTISSGATSISGAGGGTTVGIFVDTVGKPRTSFPPFLRWQVDLGGTTPGWTGTLAIQTTRRN